MVYTPPYSNDQHDPASAIPVYVVGQPPGAGGASKSTYQPIAAGQTNLAISTTGAIGDLLQGLLVTPTTTAPGAVTIGDGVAPNIVVFVGGVGSIGSLTPIPIPLGARSKTGGWRITTGANMTVVAVGSFT